MTAVPRPGYRLGAPWAGRWNVVLDTDASAWGGSGYRIGTEADPHAGRTEWQGQPCSFEIDLPPLAVVWLTSDRPAAG